MNSSKASYECPQLDVWHLLRTQPLTQIGICAGESAQVYLTHYWDSRCSEALFDQPRAWVERLPDINSKSLRSIPLWYIPYVQYQRCAPCHTLTFPNSQLDCICLAGCCSRRKQRSRQSQLPLSKGQVPSSGCRGSTGGFITSSCSVRGVSSE